MRALLFLLCTVTILATGCGSKVGGKPGKDGLTRTTKASKVVKGMEANAFETDYLEGSARIDLESEKLNIGGTGTIRLERDKAIWMSVKKFGFEGARVLIRPDSFFVLNRLNGDYTAEPLSYVERKYQIPADFNLLQKIILGNAVFFTRDLELTQNGDVYELSGEDSRYATSYLVDGASFKLQQMDLRESGSDRKITILNKDFRTVEAAKQEFAYGRTVRVNSTESGRAMIEMNFRKVELDGPLQMPFPFR
ncbi:DUF4292 domain-containing protein [Lewinella sp. 4G2]|uniref:DUF4292 domain-containing protein n=1 Tax=Lewinella sp. 4G2 TaxID=1803372 RepID=UPI0007B4CC4A|nr:DUF4292 domain-containing protein [Lewinella sp. 4G2]OAV43090.1 hypothetical protein A3850_000615 [Lewinella sp. 4G2]